MAGHPFISTRKYIKWGDALTGENTDTVVLTTAGKYFVDIRIYLPTSTSLPATSLPSSRLEWGFAGTASSTPATPSSPAHTIWTHWVDSKTIEEVKDEGDMCPQPNGEVLEYGSMVNPESGKMETYEERWIDLDPNLVRTEQEFRSWTLKAEEDGAKGMLVRIGEYVQGVMRRGEDVSVSRWKWCETKEWELIASIGDLRAPVEAFKANVTAGARFEGSDGVSWECVEAYNWK